jgi:hypothetical protein
VVTGRARGVGHEVTPGTRSGIEELVNRLTSSSPDAILIAMNSFDIERRFAFRSAPALHQRLSDYLATLPKHWPNENRMELVLLFLKGKVARGDAPLMKALSLGAVVAGHQA